MNQKVVALVGGVGGAKVALGLQSVLPPDQVTIVVNTADDFWHYGLRICPDLDTVMYTLSGRVDPVNGWGVANDTTRMLDGLRIYGEDVWFRLGDEDLATHLLRTEMLRSGRRLTEIITHLSRNMGIQCRILPMTDQNVATIVKTVTGEHLGFQEYFVRFRWQPVVQSLHFDGIEAARMSDEVQEAVQNADIILIGPSNPWLSIEPILALPGMRSLLAVCPGKCVAITPLVEGRAIKGPTAKLMAELGYEVNAGSVAEFYADAIQGFVFDERDAPIKLRGVRTIALDTIMNSDQDKARLVRQTLDWITSWEEL